MWIFTEIFRLSLAFIAYFYLLFTIVCGCGLSAISNKEFDDDDDDDITVYSRSIQYTINIK